MATPSSAERYQTIAKQWEATGYILQFVDDVLYADVRIEFWDQYVSEVGDRHLSTPPPWALPTCISMSLRIPLTRQRPILHEFGHALGWFTNTRIRTSTSSGTSTI